MKLAISPRLAAIVLGPLMSALARSWRVETVFPVYDEAVKRQIRDIISIQWSDNRKARIIDRDSTNAYQLTVGKPVQSQVETYWYFKELLPNQL